METIYYDGQELKERIEEFLDKTGLEKSKLESIEFKTLIAYPDLETFKNKYRLLYGEEFDGIRIDEFGDKLIINVLSNDTKIHLTGSLEELFREYRSLKNLDISNFDTSNVTNMKGMFGGCLKLKTLDLSNFDTSNVTYMELMFSCCTSIEDLDLSNFDTSNVTSMLWMFQRCSKLKTVDLSNFNTRNVTKMLAMFDWCNITNLVTTDTRILSEYADRLSLM